MLRLFFAPLLVFAFTSTSASASLLWKDQAKFDKRKAERQAALQKDLYKPKKSIAEDSQKELLAERAKIKNDTNEAVAKINKMAPKTVPTQADRHRENSNDIMAEAKRVKKARKIIGAMKSMSPSRFFEIFKMSKPEFAKKDNQDI